MLRLAMFFYLPMLIGGFFLRPPGVLVVEDWSLLGTGVVFSLGFGLATVGFSRWSTLHTHWGQTLQKEFRQVLGPLESHHILWLALLSALGEEVLFRGVLQPRIGLWWTAGLFGVFHFPYRRGLVPWTLFALILGVILGGLTSLTESLWPAIFLHFIINYFNLHDLATKPMEKETTNEPSDDFPPQ